MTLKHPKDALRRDPQPSLARPGRSPGHRLLDTGSSEAAMLGGLALKRRWRQQRRAAGKPIGTPNLVMGINVQVCWEKFANYWDVEMRLVPVDIPVHVDGASGAFVAPFVDPELEWDFPLPRVASINTSQHYNFLRLGFEGYQAVQGYAREVATTSRRRSKRSAPSS